MKDLERIDFHEKKAPLRLWLERLKNRLRIASPQVEALKPQSGIALFRLQQAPHYASSDAVDQLFILLPTDWLKGESSRDDWFSEREREALSSEFSVRSWIQVRQERILTLHSWMGQAKKIIFLDAHYQPDGKERESLFPVLKEIMQGFQCLFESSQESKLRSSSLSPYSSSSCIKLVPEERSAYCPWLKSYGPPEGTLRNRFS